MARLHRHHAKAGQRNGRGDPGLGTRLLRECFTHANVLASRVTRRIRGSWESLKGKRRRFPTESLIQLPQTLEQFVCGERAIMRIEHTLSLRAMCAGRSAFSSSEPRTGSAIVMGCRISTRRCVYGTFAGLTFY